MLIYPQKLLTSALFEAGYALAQGLPSHYFVRDRQDLPFLMRELPGLFDGVHRAERLCWQPAKLRVESSYRPDGHLPRKPP